MMELSNTTENIHSQYHDLVLIGGGHTHALAIRMLAMQPIKQTRITLISPDSLTPYSGMLPGLIAGHYHFADTHIDLTQLCQWAKIRFIREKVTHINTQEKTLQLASGSQLPFDYLSVDIGSTPAFNVAGAKSYSVPVKPVSSFYSRWQNTLAAYNPTDTLSATLPEKLKLAVVGSGAGGCEISLAMAHALKQRKIQARITLIGSELLPQYPKRAKTHMENALKQSGISFLQAKVTNVNANIINLARASNSSIALSEVNSLSYDQLFWCTQGHGHDLVLNSDLASTEDGFIKVNNHLQSESHPRIFAAGDCAHFSDKPLPKAGVFAVRQAPVLVHNLRAVIEASSIEQSSITESSASASSVTGNANSGKKLKTYQPQQNFLSLLATGDKHAIARRGKLSFSGKLLWRLKDYIDRQFMDQFSNLPEIHMQTTHPADNVMHCAGCGSKLGSAALSETLAQLDPVRHDNIMLGNSEQEDVSAIEWPTGQNLLQSHDYFPAFIDDPALFGRIAAIHSLSDIYAANGLPHSALATVCLEYQHPRLQQRDLKALMEGAVSELNRANCALIGGHTIEGPQLAAGFTINGLGQPRTFSKGGAQPGDILIATKPLGTGVILAAHAQGRCKGPWLDGAIQSMLQHNRNAADIFVKHGVLSCTDITGFGLLGHLLEMCDTGQINVELHTSYLSWLEGARQLAQEGIHSSLKISNDKALSHCHITNTIALDILTLLTDPQTSGGLLAFVPAENAQACTDELTANGLIGRPIGLCAELSKDITRVTMV